MTVDYSEEAVLTSGVAIRKQHYRLERPGRPAVMAEVLFLNGMLYLWIGQVHVRSFDNLQLAYPSQVSANRL